MHFIEQFKKDAETLLGFKVEVEVNRGSTIESKRWTILTPDNVSLYDYSVYSSEEYRIIATPVPKPSPLNGYWSGIVSNFYLQYLPGCCGVCLSYHANVTQKYQNKKIGTLARKFRQDIARAQGFTTMLSTATTENSKQNKIMEKTGALSIYSFKNARSGNEVVVSAFDLLDRQTDTVPVGKFSATPLPTKVKDDPIIEVIPVPDVPAVRPALMEPINQERPAKTLRSSRVDGYFGVRSIRERELAFARRRRLLQDT
jgi:hypothetical protein